MFLYNSWASTRGFPQSNETPELQRLARKLKLFRYDNFKIANNKGADQCVDTQAGLSLCCL